jgi:hypothetical protein
MSHRSALDWACRESLGEAGGRAGAEENGRATAHRSCGRRGRGRRSQALRARRQARLAVGADTVIACSPVRVAEHLVGLGDDPETAGSVWVPGVRIRMDVVGQPAVSTSDLVVAGAWWHL